MRTFLFSAALTLCASHASAETWVVREGSCANWQSRWEIEQEQTGVWVGTIDHLHIGGPCAQSRGEVMSSDVRAVIAGDNLFALRTREDGKVCSYVARMVGENRGRGIVLCEGDRERTGFVIRFRATADARPMREIPPDDELLTEEQRRRPDRPFEFRGFEELFGR